MPKTICVDFDGVLNTYTGWKGEDYLYDPRPGAKEFIEELLDNGYEVIIHSTRSPEKIGQWLKDNKFRGCDWMRVSKEKPPAIAYVDDRAICFTGNFRIAIEQVKDFRAHWESNAKS